MLLATSKASESSSLSSEDAGSEGPGKSEGSRKQKKAQGSDKVPEDPWEVKAKEQGSRKVTKQSICDSMKVKANYVEKVKGPLQEQRRKNKKGSMITMTHLRLCRQEQGSRKSQKTNGLGFF